jgi:hypothetical protein
MIDKTIEIETAFGIGNIAKIMPVGYEDVMIGQHRFGRGAQKRRKVARHGSNQQHPRLRRFGFLPEVKQRCKGRRNGGFFRDSDSAITN